MTGPRSVSVYRWLSALYPRSFRAKYGDDLVAAFRHQVLDEGPVRAWLRVIRDLAVTVPSQHLEAHMKPARPQAVTIVATTVMVAAIVLAVMAGTGLVVGIFLPTALVAFVVATWSWRAARPAGGTGIADAGRWRTYLSAGVVLLGATILAINVPAFEDDELPGAAWALMMLCLVTGVALVAVGTTMGLASRHPKRTGAS